jgi:hypothetical protein
LYLVVAVRAIPSLEAVGAAVLAVFYKQQIALAIL